MIQKELFYILLFLFFSCKQDNRKEELYLEKTNQLEKDLEVLKTLHLLVI